MRLKIIGTEVALATTAAAASDFSNAREVRLVHDATAATTHLVTITDSSGTTLATFSMPASNVVVIRKEPTHKIFASNDDIRGVAVSYVS